MKAAEKPSTNSVSMAADRVRPSHGLTLKRMLEISRPPAAASGRPARSPMLRQPRRRPLECLVRESLDAISIERAAIVLHSFGSFVDVRWLETTV
jgi:hypothetical protein